MKLGEIKLMALKLMFVDTDITYNISDIEEYYNNNNTREKLIRMNDSINRALNLYYQRVGLPRAKKTVVLDGEGDGSTYFLNSISDLYAQIPDLYNVLKVRILSTYKSSIYNADFEFNDGEIVFTNLHRYITETENENMTIEVFYETVPRYIENTDVDTEFDLDTINIPNEIQFEIPKYVKGEMYEEDEPQMALYAKNEFLNYLQFVKKPHIIKQQKVKTKNWNK